MTAGLGPESWWEWMLTLMGLGGSGALVKSVLTASETQHRIAAIEHDVADHGQLLDEHSRCLATLEANSVTGVRDRKEMLESLHRIEARIR